MRWSMAWLAALLLAATGCLGGSTEEPPDEVGVSKPGTQGDAPAPPGQPPAEMPERAASGNPPEGYRERGQVMAETPATQGPDWKGGRLEQGQDQPAGWELQTGGPEQQREQAPQQQEQQGQ